MKLLKSEWNSAQRKYYREWVADSESEITADFDPDSASGSLILTIAEGAVYMKNTQEKWQEFGGTKVIG